MKTKISTLAAPANRSKTIWVFSPSRTDPKDLEFIFVQRHQLLQDTVERVRESALTKHKHHMLFVGPRGCGKTHFVTLTVSRLGADRELADRLRIAWLNEDETCTSLLELLVKIFQALEKGYPDEYQTGVLDQAYELPPEAALEFITRQLLSRLGDRTLLVVAENLDAIFDALADAGQKEFRAFIQEHSQISIVATAQRLVEDLSDRNRPFFGFFQTEHLKRLNIEEATALLQNIARLHGKNEVVQFLATSRGRSRVRAIHHLSGGNHRIYIVLSQFITRDSIDALLGPFLKMVDELTPYYQERIRWLAPLQRKIVEYLCTCETTVPVKEIAKRLFASPQTISSQLQDLREKGYVEANQRGRESLYEVSEPLMRICVEVKENQKFQPLRLLVDFLRVWYDEKELQNRRGQMASGSAACAYLESAIQRNNAEGNLRKRIFIEELETSLPEKLDATLREKMIQNLKGMPEGVLVAMARLTEGKRREAMDCLNEAIAENSTPSEKPDLLLFRAQLHTEESAHKKALEDYTTVIELAYASVEQVAMALLSRGITHGQAGESRREIEDYTAVIELAHAPVEPVAIALLYRGITHGHAGEAQREIEDYTAVIELAHAPVELVAKALLNRGITHGQAGETQREIEDYTAVIELAHAPVEPVAKALLNRGVTYGQAGETQRAIEDCTAVIELAHAPVEPVVKAFFYRGITHGHAGETRRAIEDFTAVIELAHAPVELVARALVNRGVLRRRAGETQHATEDYTAVIELANAPAEQVAMALFNRGVAHRQAGETQRALEDYTAVIEMANAPVEQVAMALFNRGVTHGQAGETQREIEDYTAVIKLPNASAKQVAMALFYRGITYGQAGETQRALEDYTAAIELSHAPVEPVAMALYNRGVLFFNENRTKEAQLDLESLIHLAGAPSDTVVDSYLALSEVHFSEGKWNEGFQALASGLEFGTKLLPPYRATATNLIALLFSAGLNPESRYGKITQFLDIYAKYQALPVLGEAVVQHMGNIFKTEEPFPASDNLEGWVSAWEQAAESVAEFRLSVRLLRTITNFVKAGGKNPGILLDLPAPERAILQQALGLTTKEE